MKKHCRVCSHPTICDSHGCGKDESKANKARREKSIATALLLQRCANDASAWLARGCDDKSVPRAAIAALVSWTLQTTADVAAMKPNVMVSGLP